MARGTVIDRLVTILGYEYDAEGLKKFEKGLTAAKDRLDAISRKAAVWGTAITGTAAGMVAVFSGAETELAKIQGLVGISAEQIEAWQPELRRISEKTAVSLKDLGEALFFITSAGLRGSEAMEVLESTAQAAKAGLGDQAAIADVVTSAINAYGSETLSATDAVNSLVEAVRLGKLAPESLAAAMGRALPIASAMGIEFQEVAAILAAMSKTGTTVEEGVTQLNALMSALIKPQANSTRALEAVGLTVKDLRDLARDKGIFAMLEMLQGKFGTGDAWIEALGQVIPNVRAMRGVLDLMGPQMESNKVLLDEMADSTGVLDEAVAAIEPTIGYKFKDAMNRANLAMYGLGEALAPTAVKFINFGNRILDWYNRLDGVAKKVIVPVTYVGGGLLLVSAAAKVTAIAFGGLSTAIKVAIAMKVWLAKQAYFTAIALKTLAVGQKLAAAAQWLLNAAVAAFPVFAIILALAAVAYAIYRFRDQIVGGLKAAFDWIKQHWPKILAVLGGPFTAAIYLIYRFRDQIFGILKRVVEWIMGLGKTMYEAGRRFLLSFWEGIKSVGGKLLGGVKGIFGKVRKFLPFSDAKEGPFSDLTKSGRAFAETFATGIGQGVGAIERAISTLAVPLPVGTVSPATVVGGGGRSFTFSVERVEVNVPSGDPDVIAAEIAGRMDSEMRYVAEGYDSDYVA